MPTLDRWLLRAFSPATLPDTVQAIADAQDEDHDEDHDEELLARATEAKRIIADCHQRLARYRAALEAGTDPALIARWTDVNTTRAVVASSAFVTRRPADPPVWMGVGRGGVARVIGRPTRS